MTNQRFWSRSTTGLTPYIPGEQPGDRAFCKLNTNECPYPPSPAVAEALRTFDSGDLRLYPDPDAAALTSALAAQKGLRADQVLLCGGSDEALAFAFMAFFDRGDTVCFADITYGFYAVYARLFGLQAHIIPLAGNFTISPADYRDAPGGIFLANPNAPTGIALTPTQIEEIVAANPDRLVVVDEAYIDYAPVGSCIPLLAQHNNLLVVQTFSKSRALAGMRLGAAFANAGLIEAMNRVKFSFNPYNIDRVSLAVGYASVQDPAYLQEVIAKVTATRERTAARLLEIGCTVLPSATNFLFVAHPRRTGHALYEELKQAGILARYFDQPRTHLFIRVSIGTDAEMDRFLREMEAIK